MIRKVPAIVQTLLVTIAAEDLEHTITHPAESGISVYSIVGGESKLSTGHVGRCCWKLIGTDWMPPSTQMYF